MELFPSCDLCVWMDRGWGWASSYKLDMTKEATSSSSRERKWVKSIKNEKKKCYNTLKVKEGKNVNRCQIKT